jgi:hypothetical protein
VSDDTYLVYPLITGTFQGTDLCQALEEVGVMAGVNIVCDANISGSVWAELKEVSLETALKTLLAGAPYVCETTPHSYFITTRQSAGDTAGHR